MLFWYNLVLLENTDGLFCMGFDGNGMHCNGNHYTWGSAADSAYEYMLKQWVLTDGKDQVRPLLPLGMDPVLVIGKGRAAGVTTYCYPLMLGIDLPRSLYQGSLRHA